jgi:putative FmdB family regulatory protein
VADVWLRHAPHAVEVGRLPRSEPVDPRSSKLFEEGQNLEWAGAGMLVLDSQDSCMPIYEYVCQDCSRRFEILVSANATPACPSCKSEKLERQLSVFGVGRWGGPSAAATGACGACGNPRGPGSCAD